MFRNEVADFVTDIVGPPTDLAAVHVRAWSSVWRAETEMGIWFVKENCPEQDHEAELLLTLEDIAPGRVVPVLATQGAMFLMPDLGSPLGESVGDDLAAWCRVVVAAAELQVAVAPHVDRLGLVSLPPSEAPGLVTAAIDRLGILAGDDPRRLGDEDAARLRTLMPTVERWAEQVAALDLPLTLVHNDLHAHNVFEVDGRIRLFDLGDAVAMEPLAGLLVPLNVLAHHLEAGPDDPRLWRVADAALEVWSDVAPIAELRDVLPVALQLGRLGRVESWERVSRSMNPAELAEYGDAAAYWLGSLALDPPLGHLTSE
ncbi:MAG: aminoglycoside phosphotransferase family protein [Actinomycetota bacterium]|nr:aminoglycoside phosphotransferase family protein [Actinomycetota bacterium]